MVIDPSFSYIVSF